MFKKSTLFIFAILFVVSLVNCASSDDTKLTLDKDAVIELSKGKILTIELKANHTTGYRWQVLEEKNEGIIEQEGEAEYITSSTQRPMPRGSGGIEVYHFKAVKNGEAKLVFEYRRPWEKKEPARRYILTIKIK